MDFLKQHRAHIDSLDRQIIDLLRERYDVIESVAPLKAARNIPAVLQDRVDEVRENAAAYAKTKNLDSEFIGHLWAQLIAHSCAHEHTLIVQSQLKKQA
jgi:chorismate mutase-like protein